MVVVGGQSIGHLGNVNNSWSTQCGIRDFLLGLLFVVFFTSHGVIKDGRVLQTSVKGVCVCIPFYHLFCSQPVTWLGDRLSPFLFVRIIQSIDQILLPYLALR